MWFKIAKNRNIHWAILEIAADTYSPFCPNLADFSTYVQPALQNGSRFFFYVCNFESHKHPHNKFWSQNLLNFFFLRATLANLGEQLRKACEVKKIHWAILEGRWYTGRKIRQIWAEWLCELAAKSKMPRIFILMKNGCLVTIFYEFIVRYVWTNFLY